jgi:hypothetical protein
MTITTVQTWTSHLLGAKWHGIPKVPACYRSGKM